MAGTLLFATDMSPFSRAALNCTRELAALGIDEMVVLNVVETKAVADYGDVSMPHVDPMQEKAERELHELMDGFDAGGMRVRELVRLGNPAAVIVDTARAEDAAIIVMGAHGKGFMQRLLLGSVTEKVLSLADRPVLIAQCRVLEEGGGISCEGTCERLLDRILVAEDFSDYGARLKPALHFLLSSFCAPVTLLHIQEGPVTRGFDQPTKAERRNAAANMRALVELAEEFREDCPAIETEAATGSPAPWILHVADDVDASLIVVGALGERSGGWLLGSVAEKVVRASTRPVLVLRAPDEAA